MTTAAKFKVQLVGGSSDFVDCPDPNEARWEWMEAMTVSLTGRGVQQGKLRVTLSWEFMSDEDFGALMDLWHDTHNTGYRLEEITVPTFAGSSNAVYDTYGGAGTPGGYIRMLMPLGRRMILHVQEVSVVFEDIVEAE